MDSTVSLSILAALPTGFGYISPYKVGVVVLLVFGWAYAAQWVDRDTHVVKTRREHWNTIVLSGGLVGFFVLFAVPYWSGSLFLVGVGAWLATAGAALVLYLMHRNSRTGPSGQVLNIAHLKRALAGDPNKRPKDDKGLRVQVNDYEDEFVERPTDPDEIKDYEAVQDFLYDVLWRRASDVDMLSGKDNCRVVYHIDGAATEQADGIPSDVGERIFRFLKRIAGLNVEEIRRPQSGKIHTSLISDEDGKGFTEVHTSGTTAGERLRLHIQAGPTLMKLDELGMAPQRVEMLKELLETPSGLLIISATPRNGASSTQYAVLRSHDVYMHNIHALERRSMVELDNITQQIYDGSNADVNYARVLQTLLRREPDIVLVADCDDRETSLLAARASVDNRKVYLGLHALDSFDALSRYIKFVNENAVVARSLLGVMNQRLVRKLCETCREAYRPDAATLKKLNLPADKIERFYRPPSEQKFDKKGREIVCPACQGTGYVGRQGVYELLVVDDAIRNLIIQGAPIKTIKAQCRKNRMYYLQEEGLLKVIDGTTSMNEVLRVLRHTEKQG